MKHPEIILLPIMMFADYYLTVIGAILKDRKYGDYFKSEHYELNPIFQKTIAAKKWFSARHFLLTILQTCLVGFLAEFGGLPDYLIQGIFGCLFVLYGTIIGRHLSNILIFLQIDRAADTISGQITMAHSLALSISTYQYLVVAVPMAILAAGTRAPFATGGLSASCCFS
jgi:hypothetical protein